jgi:hypothetical protein
MSVEPTLLERLQAAADAALADIGPTLEHEPGKLQSVTIELELANGGQVVDATAWAQRRARVGALR